MAQDTRKDKRATLDSLVVRYKSATVDEFIENHSHDVSAGGLFVQTESPFTAGTLLKFEIRIGNEQSVIVGVGRVVWKRDTASPDGRPSGMGVKFIKIDDPSKALIRSLVEKNEGAGSEYQAGMGAPAAASVAPTAAVPVTKPASQSNLPAAKADLPAAAAPLTASPSKPAAPAPAAAAAKPAAPAPAARSTFASRKSTMLGIGAVNAEAIAAAAAEKAAEPAKKPERPQGLSFSVPASEGFQEHEPTVMKQAAELLAEALREAGGSMEEVGQNPLFSGAPKRSEPPPPVAPATPAAAEPAPATAPMVTAAPAEEFPDTRRVVDVLGETLSDDAPKTEPIAAAAPAPTPVKTVEAPKAAEAVPAAETRAKREPFKTKVSAGTAAAPPPAEEPSSGSSTWLIAIVILLVGGGAFGAWKAGLFGGSPTTTGEVPVTPPSSVQVLPPASMLAPVASVTASAEPEPAASAPVDAGVAAPIESAEPAASAKVQPTQPKPYTPPKKPKPVEPTEPSGSENTSGGTSGSGTSGTSGATEPKPTEPKPTEPTTPTEPKPTEPKPKPTEPELQ